jgi:hypothetical protein
MDESVVGLIAVVLIVGGLIFYRQSQLEDGLVKQQQELQIQHEQLPADSATGQKGSVSAKSEELQLELHCSGYRQQRADTLSGRHNPEKSSANHHRTACP